MNIELHERLMRVTVDTFKRETDKLKAELAKEKGRNGALRDMLDKARKYEERPK